MKIHNKKSETWYKIKFKQNKNNLNWLNWKI